MKLDLKPVEFHIAGSFFGDRSWCILVSTGLFDYVNGQSRMDSRLSQISGGTECV